MNLVETPEIVNWPQCHYVYIEKIGPFQNTASKAWETLQQLVPGISENNKITKFFSLYKMSEKLYRAGVAVATPPAKLPAGLAQVEFAGGKYSRFRLTGSYSELPQASSRVFQIVSERKIKLRDDFYIEHYVNDPKATPLEELVTDILVPTV